MPGGGQAFAEIWSKVTEYTRCLGITWNAQTTTGTFCNKTFHTQKVVCIYTPAEGRGRYRIGIKWADTKRYFTKGWFHKGMISTLSFAGNLMQKRLVWSERGVPRTVTVRRAWHAEPAPNSAAPIGASAVRLEWCVRVGATRRSHMLTNNKTVLQPFLWKSGFYMRVLRRYFLLSWTNTRLSEKPHYCTA